MTFALNSSGLQSVDLTTRDAVKELIDGSTVSTGQDDLIDSLITNVSSQITRFLGFHTLTASRTEQYMVGWKRRMLTLDARPVSAVTSFKYAQYPSDIASATERVADDYTLNKAGGWIKLHMSLIYETGTFQVTYSGGLGLTGGEVLMNHPEISHACAEQVAYRLNRVNSVGGSISTIPGAGARFTKQYMLLDTVRETLSAHRRASM